MIVLYKFEDNQKQSPYEEIYIIIKVQGYNFGRVLKKFLKIKGSKSSED